MESSLSAKDIFLIDVTAFTFMALFIARLGAVNSAAHQIAGNVAAVMYMLPLALGNGVGVLVAQRGRLESRSIQFRRTGAEAGARCDIDTEALAHAFTNILVNAIDAAPEASDVALVTEVLPGGAWRMRLTNGGVTLSPDDRKRAFEIFFSTKPGGNGIGLAICQRIVEEHGGTIALASSATAGTTVTIVIPAAG